MLPSWTKILYGPPESVLKLISASTKEGTSATTDLPTTDNVISLSLSLRDRKANEPSSASDPQEALYLIVIVLASLEFGGALAVTVAWIFA
jgi:hypothetical protein